MLGAVTTLKAVKKAVVGGSVLGLLATGVALAPTPVQAAPTACVIATQPAEVSADAGHPGQQSMGTWTDVKDPSQQRPRYGLYYPPTDPTPTDAVPRVENFGGTAATPATPVQTGDDFQFRLNGTCKDSGARFESSGSAIGYCGRSVGLGVGSLNGRSYIVRWESVGSQLILLDPSARGSVNAQANPPGSPNGSCVSGTAITFLVDGAIVDTTP
ncbi:MAG TPA: hypothetical protein VGO92_02425 [Acidimicrobiales bacterium]|jgi:hypothetical protein|nr:hypothetical protein [Acidimicrobiales bacterium]